MPFLSMIGMTSGHTNKLWRNKLLDAVRSVLKTPGIHKKFADFNGEAAGYLRADLREVDEAVSRPGAPDLPCRTFQAVPIGEPLRYRIPLVANARRFRGGHRVRLFLTSDDQDPNMPAFLTFSHASVGTSCLNTVRSSSRLVLPVVSG